MTDEQGFEYNINYRLSIIKFDISQDLENEKDNYLHRINTFTYNLWI